MIKDIKPSELSLILPSVFEAMTDAYIERSSPDGGVQEAEAYSYEHFKDMTVETILSWYKALNEGCAVHYSATYGNFYIGNTIEEEC